MTVAETLEAVGSDSAPARPFYLYHWGGLKAGGKLSWLVDHGDDDSTFCTRYAQKQRDNAKAGAGLYLSDNLYDSAEYVSPEVGALVQAKILVNVIFIDMTAKDVVKALKDKNAGRTAVTMANIYKIENRARVLIKYQPSWFVLKTCVNVEFKLFDGVELSVPEIVKALPKIKRKSRTAFDVLVGQLDPTKKGNIDDKLLK